MAIIFGRISTTHVRQTKTNQNMRMPPRTAFSKYVFLVYFLCSEIFFMNTKYLFERGK